MRRIASHYVYWQTWHRLHYIEIDAAGCLVGVFPLVHETASTEFYDGTLVIVPADMGYPTAGRSPMDWLNASRLVKASSPVHILHLTDVSPATAELGTDYSRGYCHVERL